MSAVFSGNTPGVSGMCQDFDTNAAELNSALENAEILTNGVLTLTQIDGSTFTNNIPYFADFVISGLNLNISNVPVNRTLTYTAGTYQINAQVYSIPVGANFQLTAGHPTLPRIDILYLTNTNNIIYQTGVPSVNPVQPAPPAGTLLLAAIGVQINATTSLNYTLVTVNTNSSTIAPPALTPGTISGSHLYWDGLTWSENTFWNVGNSTFDPTARIHTYTDTDASGIVTTAKLGESATARGFYWLINDSLNGFSATIDFSTNPGLPVTYDIISSDSNLLALANYNLKSDQVRQFTSNNTNDRSAEIVQQDSSIVSILSTEVFDPANYTRITQNINQILFEAETGSSNSTFNFNSNFTLLEVSDGVLTNSTGITDIDINNKIFQDPTNKNEFTQTLTTTDSLITQGTNTSLISQDITTEKIRLQQFNLTNTSILDIEPDVINMVSDVDTNIIGLNSISLSTTGALGFNPGDITLTSANAINLGATSHILLNGALIKNQRNTAIATAIANNDWMIVSTAALTVTLPAAPDNGRELVFRSVTGTMTINGNGKNIEAAPTQTVTVGNSRTLVFNTALNRWLNI